MKKNKKNLSILGILTVIMIVGAFFFLRQNASIYRPSAVSSNTLKTLKTTINSDVNLSDIPAEAVTERNAKIAKNLICDSMKASYINIDEVKKKEKIDIRFVNIHKKVDGIVYRLRYFLKESSESEIPTYLVYKENQNDEDILTEKSAYKKGKLYNKIEKSTGDILYTEEAMNIGQEQDLFLRYENRALRDLQGVSTLQGEKDLIECQF